MRFHSVIIITLVVCCLIVPGLALAKKDGGSIDAQVKGDLVEIESSTANFSRQVEDLQKNYDREIEERDKLILQKRFVAGKEFYFMLEDYYNAAEIFWGIVNHPYAPKFNKLNESIYYLAEALFHMGYYTDAENQYQRLISVGNNTPYYFLSLLRMVEISVARAQYSKAEQYYSKLLSEAPQGFDSSLGLYLIGKGYNIRGDKAKAFQTLEQIPSDSQYFALAQYYMAVLQVKNGQTEDALERLRRLAAHFNNQEKTRMVTGGDDVHREQVKGLTNLSLGRILYEENNFPQALIHYMAVPSEDNEYPEALYEAMWVMTTRNDTVLQAINNENSDFAAVANDYAGYYYSLEKSAEKTNDFANTSKLTGEANQLEGDLQSMEDMFRKIDENLAKLQEGTIKSYNDLVKAQPGSPLVPEAELLVGGVYTQIQDYQKAEDWYKKVMAKYGRFLNQVNQAHTVFQRDQAAVGAVAAGSKSMEKHNGTLVDSSSYGVPPEVAYWLAADKKVKQQFELYEMALKARNDVREMQQMLEGIRRELRNLESSTGFPILKETYRRLQELRGKGMQLEQKIQTTTAASAGVSNEKLQSEAQQKLPEYRSQIKSGLSTLATLESKLRQRKQQKIASYKEELRTYAAPVASYAQEVEQLYGLASNETAQVARTELTQIETQLHDYITQAEIGIMDLGYKATQGSGREIKRIQREMEEEIRKFRRQIIGTPESSGDNEGKNE